MDEQGWRRVRGLRRLLHDGVALGADFVERHHRRALDRPYRLIEAVVPDATPVRVARTTHGALLSATYVGIRAANSVAGVVGGWVVDRLEAADADAARAAETGAGRREK